MVEYSVYSELLKVGPAGIHLISVFLPLAFLSGLLGVAIFRIYLHPLKSHPGPLFGRLSDLYNTFHIVKKDEARNFHELHKRYGPVVRYGPNRLSIASPDAVRMLYTNSRYSKKADSYLAFPRNPENASLFSSINKEVHARKRRVLRHGFSDAALKEAEVTIKNQVATLLLCLEHLDDDDQEGWKVDAKESAAAPDRWSSPKNWAVWINRYSFDLSSDLSFSKSFDMMRLKDRRLFADGIHDSMWAENVVSVFQCEPSPSALSGNCFLYTPLSKF